MLQVGTPVVVIVEDEEMVPAFSSYTAADAGSGGASSGSPVPVEIQEPVMPAAPAASVVPATTPSQARYSAQSASASGRKNSSPYARKLAKEAGIDLGKVAGSGPRGRITAADVEQAVVAGGAATPTGGTYADFTEEAVKQVQKITARRLLESKTTVPHYYLTDECQVDRLMSLRKELNEHLKESGGKISVNDFIIKACASALRAVPDVNSSWHGEFIRRYSTVDISFAVQTTAGLMVPVVRDADLKGLQAISEDVKVLASQVWRDPRVGHVLHIGQES